MRLYFFLIFNYPSRFIRREWPVNETSSVLRPTRIMKIWDDLSRQMVLPHRLVLTYFGRNPFFRFTFTPRVMIEIFRFREKQSILSKLQVNFVHNNTSMIFSIIFSTKNFRITHFHIQKSNQILAYSELIILAKTLKSCSHTLWTKNRRLKNIHFPDL